MSDAELRLLALERVQSLLRNSNSGTSGRDLEWLEQRQHALRALELLSPRYDRETSPSEPKWNRLRQLPARAQCHIYEFDCTYRYVYNLTLLNFELLCEEFSDDDEEEEEDERGGVVRRILEVSRVCSYFDIDVSSGIAWQCRGRGRAQIRGDDDDVTR